MGEEISWTKLVRYVQGECNPEERAEVDEWIATDDDHAALISLIEKIWDTSTEAKEDWDVDSAWLRYTIRHGRDFKEVFEKDEHGAAREHNRLPAMERNNQVQPFKWGLIAAAAAMIGLVLFFSVPSEEALISDSTPVKEIISEHGQRTHFRLSDGTRVILNAGSKILTPESFSDSVRSVELEGQAFFDVATDSARPFLVSTDRAITEVLGTKFDMRAYSQDRLVEVTVAEGKVALRSKQDTAGREITENQLGTLSNGGNASVTEIQDIAVHLGWTEGRLVFSNEPFFRVKATLERWYNIKIEVEDGNRDQLNSRRFTGTFTDSQPMEEVIEAFALSMKIKVRVRKPDGSYVLN